MGSKLPLGFKEHGGWDRQECECTNQLMTLLTTYHGEQGTRQTIDPIRHVFGFIYRKQLKLFLFRY